MILPPWWPHTCCVYCGERMLSDPEARPTRHLLACIKHRDLLALDPKYAEARRG